MFSRDLVADVLDNGLELLLQQSVTRLRYKRRIPDVQQGFGRSDRVLFHKHNQKEDQVSSHNVYLTVIDDNIERRSVALRQVRDGEDDVS